MADNLTPEQRSYCMSRICGRDTGIEKLVRAELRSHGLGYKTHVKSLPGRPDIVLSQSKIVVFVDGDFWHGYRFPAWKHKLSDFWKSKIDKNRSRDRRNFQMLRRRGWKVIRIWQHQLKHDPDSCISKILSSID
jgi:DNA mismatch endonuclease (patch repair protein)